MALVPCNEGVIDGRSCRWFLQKIGQQWWMIIKCKLKEFAKDCIWHLPVAFAKQRLFCGTFSVSFWQKWFGLQEHCWLHLIYGFHGPPIYKHDESDNLRRTGLPQIMIDIDCLFAIFLMNYLCISDHYVTDRHWLLSVICYRGFLGRGQINSISD